MKKLKILLDYRASVEDVSITPDKLVITELNDIIEVLAKASHMTWRNKRKKEGWEWVPARVEKDNTG